MSNSKRTWVLTFGALLLSAMLFLFLGITYATRAAAEGITFKEGGQSYGIGYDVDNNRCFRLELVNAADAKTAYGGFCTLPSAVDGKTNGDLILLTGKNGTEKSVTEWKKTVGTKDGDTDKYIRHIAVYGNILHFITDTKEAQNYFTKVTIEEGVRWYIGNGGGNFGDGTPPTDIADSQTYQDVNASFTAYRNVASAKATWTAQSDAEVGAITGGVSASYVNDPAGKPHVSLTLDGAADARSVYKGFETLPSAKSGKTNGDLIWLLGKDGKIKTVNEWKQEHGTKAGDTDQYIRHIGVYGNRIIFVIDAKEAQDYFVGVTVDADVLWYVGTGDGGNFWASDPPESITSAQNTLRVGKDFSMFRPLSGDAVWGIMPKYEIADGKWAYASNVVQIKSNPKMEYRAGETFDYQGLELTVKLNDGSLKSVKITADSIAYGHITFDSDAFNDGDMSFKGSSDNVAVTINYMGCETVLEGIKVADEWIESVKILKSPNKLIYDIGELFEATGLQLEIKTNKGTLSTVDYSDSSSFILGKMDNGRIGKQVIECSYEGVAFTVEVTVENKNPQTGIEIDFDSETYCNSEYSIPLIPFKFVGFNPQNLPNILWGIDKMTNVGDKILINGKTLAEMRAEFGSQTPARLTINYSGTTASLEISLDDPNWKIDKIETVEFLPGFTLITAADGHTIPEPQTEEDCLGYGYKYLENAVLKNRVILYNASTGNNQGKWVRQLKTDNGTVAEDAVTLTANKTEYRVNEPASLNDLILKVKYEDDRDNLITIPVTENMIVNPDFSATAGEKEIIVRVSGHEFSVSVTVKSTVLDSIEIAKQPNNLVGNLGRELDFSGIEVNAIWKDEVSGELLTPEKIADEYLTFTGYDPYRAGKQTVTVNYAGKSDEFEVEFKDLNPELNLSINVSGYANYESTTHHDLVFYVNLNGYTGNTKALTNLERFDNIADYILIDGKSVTELMKEGLCSGVRFWSNCVIILLNGVLQPNQEAFDAAKARSNGAITDDMKPVFIKEITIKAGFQYYTAEADNWGGNNFDYEKIEGCFLREDVILENMSGLRWRRPFAEGNDALTVNTMPDKVVYQKGEYFDITGLTLKAKYKDGGEEVVTVADSWIEGFDMNKAGEQTITVSYNGGKVTFKVTVEDVTDTAAGCGSNIGTTALTCSSLAIGLAMFFMMFRRKHKTDRGM